MGLEFLPNGLLLVGAVAFAAGGLVKGTLGMGLPLVAVPLLASVVEPSIAISLMIVPVMASNVQQAWQSGYAAAAFRRFWTLLLPLTLTALLAGWFLASAETETTSLVLGGMVLVFCASRLIKQWPEVSPEHERWLNPTLGVAAGVLGGVSHFFGPPLIAYLVALRLDKEAFVGSIALMFLFGSAALYATLATAGVLTVENLGFSALATLPLALGLTMGRRLRHHVDQRMFERGLIFVLLLIGLNLVRRGLL